jgi:hypothetical protein
MSTIEDVLLSIIREVRKGVYIAEERLCVGFIGFEACAVVDDIRDGETTR